MLDLSVELSSLSFFVCLLTEMIFILSSISGGLEFWSVNRTLIYIKILWKVFRNITFWGKISNNWPNDLLGTNVYKTLNVADIY